ncbi:MAG: Hsp70 family protein, partial [Clostridia bacterium]|nr:Hsp70 family protein [Clostridia bacterium]
EADIDKAVKEAEQYEAEDKKRREVVDNKNKLDGLIFTIEKSLKDLDDKLSDEDKSKLNDLVKEAKDELATDDNDKIVAATEKLSNESQQIFAKVYQQSGGAQQPNGDGETEFHQN